jgi:DNA-binding NtrC family response regulator
LSEPEEGEFAHDMLCSIAAPIDIEESFSLQDSERDLIKKALQKHGNRRKYAARELGISERTLYRKIKEYNLAE